MLEVRLDTPIPSELAVGAGTVLFVCGWCVPNPGRLEFLVDGEPQPVAASGMPRLDVLRALGTGYDCGFWGWVRVGHAPATLALRAGGEVVELGRIAARAPAEPVASEAAVAICMATYNPPPALLRRQLDSIRAQTFTDWVCVISDDCSSPAGFADLQAAVGDDPRFVVSRSDRRRGFYANFERALELAPAGARYVALSDQDDVWHPDKLATLVGALGDAQLVYSDARLVGTNGAVRAETYWGERDNNHADMTSLLSANAVSGSASLLRRSLLELALPFPPGQFAHFHDHWLGLCALARGDIAYVDRPLYDYVQHGGAALGHAAANRVVGLRERLSSLRREPRERIRLYRNVYFVDVARLTQMAEILLLREPGTPRRRELERFLRADTSLVAAARLWLHGAREYVGRPQTLGAERGLAYAFAWRRALGASARPQPQKRLRLDAVPPPDLAPSPGRMRPPSPVRAMAEKIAPLRLEIDEGAPPRVNVLIPTIDLDHLFGGYIGKFNLARRLAERGARVRLVCVDPVGPLPGDWRARVSAYAGLAGVFDRVEVAFAREDGLVVTREDRWVASTWWTAHVAEAARRELGGPPFTYLVQEYEPFTFPAGTWGALAEQSYRFEHRALFSTELLMEWFAQAGVGAPVDAAAFRNAITAVRPEVALRRKLLFYARPEAHAARNLFELGMLALATVAERGGLDGWAVHGIGTTKLGSRIPLGGGAALELLPRAPQAEYARRLVEHDVGLALMHTPHPSLVPLEMASAGQLVVTSTFANKTADALRALSGNLTGVEPTIDAVAGALEAAIAAAGDLERRRAGAAVDWPVRWEDALPDALLERVEGWLRAG